MVGFVVKVVRERGDWDRPIVVGANSEEHAVKLARAALRLSAKDSVVGKGVPDEAMIAADKDAQFKLVDSEAQRCRAALSAQPAPRPPVRKAQ